MPLIEIRSRIAGYPVQLGANLLCMDGVNYELGPIVKMTAPQQWRTKHLSEFPLDKDTFTSTILLFGLIPVDRHTFTLIKASESGFEERSRSWLNREWKHRRTITSQGAGCVVHDTVEYLPRVKMLGMLTKPIYAAVFRHRHNRLRKKYGALAG